MKPKAHRALPNKILPLCQKCQSYKVTWDSSQPHACLFFNFKSTLLPAIEVYNSTGMACPQYRLSKHQKQPLQFQSYLAMQVANQPKQHTELSLYSASGQLLEPKILAEQQADKAEIEERKGRYKGEDKGLSDQNDKTNGYLLGEGILL